jgi:hypothetical protein
MWNASWMTRGSSLTSSPANCAWCRARDADRVAFLEGVGADQRVGTWPVTVVLVVIYHVLYMYNGEAILGKITALDVQYYDIFLYAVYPWFMLLLFLISGICSRYYLDNHTAKELQKAGQENC